MIKNDMKPILVGHPFTPIGRGEEVRCVFRAFHAVGQSLPIRDIYALDRGSDHGLEREMGDYVVESLSSSVNIFYINGDEVKPVLNHLGALLPSDAHNVICPQWELSIYPREWAEQLERFAEIWAPSKFVYDSIRQVTSKPIFLAPLPVEVRLASFLGRRHLGLPESAYLFLFIFDFRSYVDRKNPFAVIEAFERVCTARPRDDIHLVLKVNRPNGQTQFEADNQRFIAQVNQCQYKDRIVIIDKVLSDNEIKSLVRSCDCFVSLHRSEGFGRGMAEAMFLGKPVVATGYSGNLDFMSDENSCLVHYDLVPVEEGCYPHAKGQFWAEPDIDHAVYYMIKLLDDRDYGRKLGRIASRHIRTHFSYRAMGLQYKKRMDEIAYLNSDGK